MVPNLLTLNGVSLQITFSLLIDLRISMETESLEKKTLKKRKKEIPLAWEKYKKNVKFPFYQKDKKRIFFGCLSKMSTGARANIL